MGGVEILFIGFFLLFWVVFDGWKMEVVVLWEVWVAKQEFLFASFVDPTPPSPGPGGNQEGPA